MLPGICLNYIQPCLTLIQCLGAIRPASGTTMTLLDPLAHFWWPRTLMDPPMGIINPTSKIPPQNCSNASPWMCPDLFHPCSKLFCQFGATRSAYGRKRPFLAVLDALGALWHTHMALPDPQNCSNSSLGMCCDLFHPCFTLFHQFGATRSAYGRKRPFLAVLDPVWQPSGTPRWPSLTRETVPMHHRGCALTCSTLVPLCSTSLEPLDPLMAEKGRFWLFWTLFGGPLAHPYSPP